MMNAVRKYFNRGVSFVGAHINDTKKAWVDEIIEDGPRISRTVMRRSIYMSSILFGCGVVAYIYDDDARKWVDVYRFSFHAQSETRRFIEEKRFLFQSLNGRIVEIGCGALIGSNLQAFPKERLLDYSAVGCDSMYHERFLANAVDAGFPSPMVKVMADDPLEYLRTQPDDSFDHVISTHVLSNPTSGDSDQLATEYYRVLRPNGQLYFIEHTAVLDVDSWWAKLQSRLQLLWRYVGDGCTLNANKDPVDTISKAGFTQLQTSTWRGEKRGVQRIQAGVAVKPEKVVASDNSDYHSHDSSNVQMFFP